MIRYDSQHGGLWGAAGQGARPMRAVERDAVTVLPHLKAASWPAASIGDEQPSELFEAFLGRRMKYTCALFADPCDSLDSAQEAYLRLIADELRLRGGERVLDVGCGWGSLTLFLAEHLGCPVIGITPSVVQSSYIRRRAADASLAELVRLPTRPLAERSFDAVALVEVLEHLPQRRELLQKVYRLVRGGGRLFLSASCYRSTAAQREYERHKAGRPGRGSDGFAGMTPLSHLISDIEDAGFSLLALTDTTAHYGPTMGHWRDRIERNRALMDTLLPGFADEQLRYLDTAQSGWGISAEHYSLAAIRRP